MGHICRECLEIIDLSEYSTSGTEQGRGTLCLRLSSLSPPSSLLLELPPRILTPLKGALTVNPKLLSLKAAA